jgi:TRAP-type mannitol/chloroaromatic compound transport system permease small subunit
MKSPVVRLKKTYTLKKREQVKFDLIDHMNSNRIIAWLILIIILYYIRGKAHLC